MSASHGSAPSRQQTIAPSKRGGRCGKTRSVTVAGGTQAGAGNSRRNMNQTQRHEEVYCRVQVYVGEGPCGRRWANGRSHRHVQSWW